MRCVYIAYVVGVAGVRVNETSLNGVLTPCELKGVSGIIGRYFGRDTEGVDFDGAVSSTVVPRQALLNDADSILTLMACRLAASVLCSVWNVHEVGLSIGSSFTVTRSMGEQLSRLHDI